MITKQIDRKINHTSETTAIIEEEYRSLMRLAEILSKSGRKTSKIETPLGDFLFCVNEVEEK